MRKCTNIFSIYEEVVDFAPIPLNFLIYEENFLFFFICALLKILTSDPRHRPGILGCHWLNSFCPGILLELQDFGVFCSRSGKTLYNPEVFMARKSLIGDILGFPEGDGVHSLIFLTVQYEENARFRCIVLSLHSKTITFRYILYYISSE